MLVSSSSMKVASVTVTAINQGLTFGFAADGAAATASGSETTCVLTSSLLVYAVNLSREKMRTLYAATQNKKNMPGLRQDGWLAQDQSRSAGRMPIARCFNSGSLEGNKQVPAGD